MTGQPKPLFFAGGLLLLLATVLAGWFMQPVWLFVPAGIAAMVYLLQHPSAAFLLLLLSIPWSVEYHFASGIGTDLPDEPLMLLTSFLALVLFIIHRKTLFQKRKIHPLVLLLIAQFLWIAVTVVLSTHFTLSAKYLLAKSWYWLAFVAMPLFLWKDAKAVKRSALVLFLSMLLVTAVSMVRHASYGFSFAQVNDALAPFFRNHVNYSALLVFIVPIQVAFWQGAKTKRLRNLVLLSFFITIPALYFSYARGAWLALVTGTLGYWLLRKKWLLQAFIFSVVLASGLLFWLKNDDRYLRFAHDYHTTIFHENFNEHLAATYQLKDMSTAERFHRWVAGVRMAEDSWQTGFGPTTFYQHYKGYTVPAFKTWVSRNEEQSTVHNYFLLLLVEQGAMGLLLFLLLIGMLFWYAQKIYHCAQDVFWKRTAAVLAVILVMQCTLNFLSDLVETDKAGSVFYLCIAALIVADKMTKRNNGLTEAYEA